MPFILSAEESSLKIVQGSNLAGRLRARDGSYKESHIDLNEVLGNDDGSFDWGGVDFYHTAKDIKLTTEGEGDDKVSVLTANLKRKDGSERPAKVNLDGRIENVDGQFKYI